VNVKEGVNDEYKYYLQVRIDDGGIVFLNFTKQDLHVIEMIREGDRVRFEGQIKALIDGSSPDLYSVRLLSVM
jgi:hypothetical protein